MIHVQFNSIHYCIHDFFRVLWNWDNFRKQHKHYSINFRSWCIASEKLFIWCDEGILEKQSSIVKQSTCPFRGEVGAANFSSMNTFSKKKKTSCTRSEMAIGKSKKEFQKVRLKIFPIFWAFNGGLMSELKTCFHNSNQNCNNRA